MMQQQPQMMMQQQPQMMMQQQPMMMQQQPSTQVVQIMNREPEKHNVSMIVPINKLV